MIVTKKIAEQYILKRGCYLIHEQPNGDYSISYESLNWKEGMEIFQSIEECAEEIEKRLKKRMKPGDCPRCYNKSTLEAEVDTKQLEALKGKFDPLYKCSRCQTVWYKQKDKERFIAYDQSVADYLLDWNSRDLKPSKVFRNILTDNISSDKKEDVYLQSIRLKNGEHHPCAVILLRNFPPERHWFERKDLFFLDQVDSISASPYAFSFAISKKAWKGRDFIYVKDTRTQELFRFDAFVTMFMPEDLQGREFSLVKTDEVTPDDTYKTIAERDDRGAPAYWYFKPPPDPVYIWGDRV